MGRIRQAIGRIRKSADGRVLASNFGYLMLLQVASYAFPLITIPYLARVIGVEGFGKIAFAAAVILWFQTITDWGFNYTATRDVARNRDNPEKIAEIFSNVFWARVVLLMLSLLLLLLAIAAIPYFRENSAVLLVTFLLVPGHILFPEWFFQAMERMKYITIFNVIAKALFTVMVFVFIKEKSDFILQPLFTSLGYVVSGLAAIYIIMVKWRIKIKAPNWDGIFSVIQGSANVFISNLMPNLYNSFSTVLLGFFGGSVSNGLLDAGRKFVEIAQQFLMVISRVFFPFLVRRSDKHSLYARFSFSVAVLFCLALVFSAPLIVKVFFTPEFEQAIQVLQVMSISLIFLSLSNIYGTNYMVIRGFERELRNITTLVSVVGFLLAYIFILYFDYLGAAIAITLTRVILGVGIMVWVKNSLE